MIDNLFWIKAYENNKCSLKGNWQGISGVYFLKEFNEIVYIGMSGTNLKKTLYRHFQKWNDYRNKYYPKGTIPPYPRVTYDNRNNFSISYIISENFIELEKYYIYNFQPRDNREKYNFYKYHDKEIEKLQNKSTYLEKEFYFENDEHIIVEDYSNVEVPF